MNLRFLVYAAIAAAVLIEVYCSKPSQAVSEKLNVSFERDIRPITSTVCITCHNQSGRNWSVYEDAYLNRNEIYFRVWIEKSMPFGKVMKDEDRALFRDWFNQGAKR